MSRVCVAVLVASSPFNVTVLNDTGAGVTAKAMVPGSTASVAISSRYSYAAPPFVTAMQKPAFTHEMAKRSFFVLSMTSGVSHEEPFEAIAVPL